MLLSGLMLVTPVYWLSTQSKKLIFFLWIFHFQPSISPGTFSTFWMWPLLGKLRQKCETLVCPGITALREDPNKTSPKFAFASFVKFCSFAVQLKWWRKHATGRKGRSSLQGQSTENGMLSCSQTYLTVSSLCVCVCVQLHACLNLCVLVQYEMHH